MDIEIGRRTPIDTSMAVEQPKWMRLGTAKWMKRGVIDRAEVTGKGAARRNRDTERNGGGAMTKREGTENGIGSITAESTGNREGIGTEKGRGNGVGESTATGTAVMVNGNRVLIQEGMGKMNDTENLINTVRLRLVGDSFVAPYLILKFGESSRFDSISFIV